MDFDGKYVLITGGAGFIGSTLAIRLIESGSRVTVIDSLISTYGGNLHNIALVRQLVRINISDVRDPYSMEHLVKGQDFLFNLAGQTSHLDSMNAPEIDLEMPDPNSPSSMPADNIIPESGSCLPIPARLWHPQLPPGR